MRFRKQESSLSMLTEGQQETGSIFSKNGRKSTQTTSENRHREHKIYVAGLPYKATRDDILHYFQEFGEVVGLDITYVPGVESYSANGEKDVNYRNPSRYCIVQVRDLSVFQEILSYTPHKLFGRNLYCTEFKQGSKLMKEIRLKNQRRVLLKGVPLQYKMGHIKQAIEETVGEIEAIYDFRDDIKPTEPHFEERLSQLAENPAITIDGRLLQGHEYRNYTVLFYSKVHALQLLTMGRLLIDRNVYATVEPFKPRLTHSEVSKCDRKSKAGTNKLLEPFESQFQEGNDFDQEMALQMAEVGSSVSFVNNDNQHNGEEVPKIFGKVYAQSNRGISSTTSNLPAYSNFGREASKKTNRSLFEMPSWKKQCLMLHEIQEVETGSRVLDEVSSKPTRKQYFEDRLFAEYPSTQGFSASAGVSHSNDRYNLRFNINRNPRTFVLGHQALLHLRN